MEFPATWRKKITVFVAIGVPILGLIVALPQGIAALKDLLGDNECDTIQALSDTQSATEMVRRYHTLVAEDCLTPEQYLVTSDELLNALAPNAHTWPTRNKADYDRAETAAKVFEQAAALLSPGHVVAMVDRLGAAPRREAPQMDHQPDHPSTDANRIWHRAFNAALSAYADNGASKTDALQLLSQVRPYHWPAIEPGTGHTPAPLLMANIRYKLNQGVLAGSLIDQALAQFPDGKGWVVTLAIYDLLAHEMIRACDPMVRNLRGEYLEYNALGSADRVAVFAALQSAIGSSAADIDALRDYLGPRWATRLTDAQLVELAQAKISSPPQLTCTHNKKSR